MPGVVDLCWVDFEVPNHLAGAPPRLNPAWCHPPAQCGCQCACNCPPAQPIPPQCAQFPIRYASGEIVYAVADVESHGFGDEWGHTRSFANQLSETTNPGNGNNWQVKEWSYLVFQDDGSVAVMREATKALWFSLVGNSYVADFAI